MQISITGNKIDVTEPIKEYATEKLQKIKKYVDNASATLVLSVEKHRHIAEVTIHYSGGSSHSSTETKDMYSAIDQLMDKVEKQFRKVKEKKADHKSEKTGNVVEDTLEEDEF
ncbi:MAG: ribosome-associated translation inhibitor RaiA [Nitrospinae bacterium]|nr:ribosome-associated translation inhibitor RaiA [Nitrospinota bacterium]